MKTETQYPYEAIATMIGRLYRFRGQLVKLRWVTGDDEYVWTDTEYELAYDEPGLFTYDDGSEVLLAVLLTNGELFDLDIRKLDNGAYNIVRTHVGWFSECEPVDDNWIGELLA